MDPNPSSKIGGQMVPATLWPLVTRPTAIPRLRTNHRVVLATRGT